MRRYAPLPPQRRCRGCGTVFRGYPLDCPACIRDGQENSSAMAEMARQARLARWGRTDEKLDRSTSQGELPEGF